MPDWSYGTLLRPALFRLSAARSRDLTLSAIGRLAALPGGLGLIALLGHMDPPDPLAREAFGTVVRSPVGLGAGLDVRSRATRAFARFGFGYIEVGPVCADACDGAVRRDDDARSIRYAAPLATITPDRLFATLAEAALRVPLVVRLGHRSGDGPDEATVERLAAIDTLHPLAAAFSLDTADDVAAGRWDVADWARHVARLVAAARPRALLVVVAPDTPPARAEDVARSAIEAGAGGLIVAGGIARGPERIVGEPTRERSLALVRQLRERHGRALPIVASGGIIEPAHALEAFAAGATLVQLHSGLVFGGPGLPKRVNEALLATDRPARAPRGFAGRAWSGFALLGAGMITGGVLAWLVAATSTMLDYEAEFVGLPREAIDAVNPRLLAFMAHDRISLAAGMISVGMLYAALAWFAIRRGERWAHHATVASAAVGFASFGLFLGYRYFDPLHAVVTLLLLPFLVLGLRGTMAAESIERANLRSDRRWRIGLWGQLAFVSLGAGLIVGGATISIVGMATVFVPSDLEFLGTSAAQLDAANARLLPLIAHDRAGLGGLLVSEGIAVLLISLWGIRESARWLWWTFLLAGATGFTGAIGVHVTSGYLDALHLLPAAIAVGLYVAGLLLLLPYLWASAEPGTSARVTAPVPGLPRSAR